MRATDGMSFRSSLDGRAGPGLSLRARQARGWPRAFVGLLLLCLLAQGIAVQSHLHFDPQARAATAGTSHRLGLSAPKTPDPAADCPLCQEAAMAGVYVLPSLPVLLLPPPPPPRWLAATTFASFGLLTAALGWQSRAPPQ